MSTHETVEFEHGDRVRHEQRPEWGVGRVTGVENIRVGGKRSQRLLIDFPNAGRKKISSIGAVLTRVTHNGDLSHDADTLVDHEHAHESGWLGEISKRKPEDAMSQLPAEVSDPFRSLESRLKQTCALYRFSRDGASLIDWAVARSGLDDPLSRFTRHELESFFDRWASLRDQHLQSLLRDAAHDQATVRRVLAEAPPGAQRAANHRSAT